MARKYKEYTEEELINAVKESSSCSQVLTKLNLRMAGGNYDTIRRKIAKLSLDCSHWKRQGWNADKRLKDWKDYKKNDRIKPNLINIRGHKCENCFLSIWQNKIIVLELHHIDGNRTNNEVDNLQLLCPNCHSLTPNWRGKKIS